MPPLSLPALRKPTAASYLFSHVIAVTLVLACLAWWANASGLDLRIARALFDAATKHPHLVAGTGHIDTLVMEAFSGRVMQKGGAEGVQCGAIRDKGFGYALKCDDGNMAASQAMVAALLLKFADPDEKQRAVLESFARQPVLNVRKAVVGEIRAVL